MKKPFTIIKSGAQRSAPTLLLPDLAGRLRIAKDKSGSELVILKKARARR